MPCPCPCYIGLILSSTGRTSFRAWRHTERNRRRTLQRQDLHAAVGESEVYDFLIDIVPRVTTAKTTAANAAESATNAAAAAAMTTTPPLKFIQNCGSSFHSSFERFPENICSYSATSH